MPGPPKTLLRRYFYKWKGKVRDYHIKDLKTKVLKFLYSANQERNRRNKLSQFLSKWKLFTSSVQHSENIDNLRQIRQGFDKLHKLYAQLLLIKSSVVKLKISWTISVFLSLYFCSII